MPARTAAPALRSPVATTPRICTVQDPPRLIAVAQRARAQRAPSARDLRSWIDQFRRARIRCRPLIVVLPLRRRRAAAPPTAGPAAGPDSVRARVPFALAVPPPPFDRVRSSPCPSLAAAHCARGALGCARTRTRAFAACRATAHAFAFAGRRTHGTRVLRTRRLPRLRTRFRSGYRAAAARAFGGRAFTHTFRAFTRAARCPGVRCRSRGARAAAPFPAVRRRFPPRACRLRPRRAPRSRAAGAHVHSDSQMRLPRASCTRGAPHPSYPDLRSFRRSVTQRAYCPVLPSFNARAICLRSFTFLFAGFARALLQVPRAAAQLITACSQLTSSAVPRLPAQIP